MQLLLCYPKTEDQLNCLPQYGQNSNTFRHIHVLVYIIMFVERKY